MLSPSMSFVKIRNFVFLLLLPSFLAVKVKPNNDGVYVLTESSLEKTIQSLDSVLVLFYSPKCQSCHQAESQLAKIVQLITARKLDIAVAKIDVTSSSNKMGPWAGGRGQRATSKLVGQYQLERLPSHLFFVAGGLAKYHGGKLSKSSIALL